MTTYLLCNEGKEDKQYHIVYILGIGGTSAPTTIPYCRGMAHLDVPVQIRSDNPRICVKCAKEAGLELAPVTLPEVPCRCAGRRAEELG